MTGRAVLGATVAAVVACATALAQPPPKAAAHPPGVMEHVRALQVAAIHGDTAAVHTAATWLAGHPAPWTIPVGAEPFVGAVTIAATAATAAKGVDATARATADLASSCRACHVAAGATPAIPRQTPPRAGGIVRSMTRHQIAADLMLAGLLTPSDDAWSRGTAQLREETIGPGDFPVSERIGALMAGVEARLHAQAAVAAAATATASRTSAYATLLTVCAECHTKHTTLWETPRR